MSDHVPHQALHQAPFPQAPPGAPAKPSLDAHREPPREKRPLRGVLLVLAGVLAVLVVLVGIAVLADQFDSETEQDPKNAPPVAVDVGEAFTYDGFRATAGWAVVEGVGGEPAIEGLRVTNAGETQRAAMLTFAFLEGGDTVAEVECTSSDELGRGQADALTCRAHEADYPMTFDEVKVRDTF